MPLTPPAYLEHLRRESARFRVVLADADPAGRVPTCPDWDVAALVHHLGAEVQGFWAHVVTTRPAPPDDWEDPPRPGGYDEVLAAFDRAHRDLLDALATAEPGDEAWTWSSEQTVGFTMRRQAQEALVHRVDAELAAGVPIGPLDPGLAADGVLETLDVMFGGTPSWGSFTPGDGLVGVDLVDAPSGLDRVWVRLGRFTGTDPDGTSHDEPDIAVVDADGTGGQEPDAVLSGPAGAVLLWLWRRGDDAEVHVDGDRAVYETFLGCVDHPID